MWYLWGNGHRWGPQGPGRGMELLLSPGSEVPWGSLRNSMPQRRLDSAFRDPPPSDPRVACLWPLQSARSGLPRIPARIALSRGGLFHAGQRTLLCHIERDHALERYHPVPHRTLIVPSPWEVLIIEDDELDRELVIELLTMRGRGGVRVTEARDLRSGLEALDSRRFDLVMLDTKLPEATALHALRAVGDKAPLTPILPHSAYISVQTRQTARQRGVFDAVVRGDLNAMWAAVNKLLTLSTFGSDIHPPARAVAQ